MKNKLESMVELLIYMQYKYLLSIFFSYSPLRILFLILYLYAYIYNIGS